MGSLRRIHLTFYAVDLDASWNRREDSFGIVGFANAAPDLVGSRIGPNG